MVALAVKPLSVRGTDQGRIRAVRGAQQVAGAYLYCLPSDLEGMPISLLEAMSYGNCCVTSDIPECTEVCGDHGFAFQKGNTADLKRLLEQLLSQPDMVKCCKATAADYILQKYNWDQVTERTLELYEQVKSAK